MQNVEKKILIIAYHFPPDRLIAALRPYFFAKYFLESGWEVTLLKPCKFTIYHKDIFFDILRHNNLKSHDLPFLPLLKFLSFILDKMNIKPNKAGVEKANKKSGMNLKTLISFVYKIHHSFPINIFNRGGLLYILFGVIKGIISILKNNVQFVFATYSPYSCHIIGLILKKIFKSKITLIQDFRDIPIGDNEVDIYFKKFQDSLNKTIQINADLITVSGGWIEKLTYYNKRVITLRNGIPVYPENKINYNSLSDYQSTFNIVYTGVTYINRDARGLINYISELVKKTPKLRNIIRIHHAGPDSQIWRDWCRNSGIEDLFIDHGYVSRDVVIALQRIASVNIMLNWSNANEKGLIAGKIYEYISAGKPVLCILKGSPDLIIEDFFEQSNAGLVIYNNDTDKLFSFIPKVLELWENDKNFKWNYNNAFVETLTYRYLTEEFANTILKIRSEEVEN